MIHGGTHYVERKHWGPAGHHRRFSAAAWIWLAGWIVAGSILLARLRRGAAILTRERIFMLIGVLIVLFVLTRVPVLGGALRLLLVIAGVGSLVVASAARHRAAEAADRLQTH